MAGSHTEDSHQALIVLGVLALLAVAWVLVNLALKYISLLWHRIAPTRITKAKVVAKKTSRLDLSLDPDSFSDTNTDPHDAYVSFLIEGRIVEMLASDAVYIQAVEGADGILSYRGGTAVDFKPLN